MAEPKMKLCAACWGAVWPPPRCRKKPQT